MGDEGLEKLLLAEIKIVFKYLIKIGSSKEDAEDITQDTLYKIIKNIDAIPEDKIRPWLFKVSINSYYNLYNRRKKQDNNALEEIDSIRLLSENVEETILTKESKKKVHGVLNLLKPSYKDLLILKYLMDFSYKDIGDILELSEYQVKTYLYRARNKFREIWEELNYEGK